MKKALFIASLAAVVCATSCQNAAEKSGNEGEAVQAAETVCAPAGSIVYFNLDKVLEQYDKANDLRSVVETKANGIQQDLMRRQKKLEKDVSDFQNKISKGLLTQAMAEEKGAKLEEQRNSLLQYSDQKNREMAEEQTVMMNQIADAISTFVQEYNETKGYAMILTTQGGAMTAPVVTADPLLDITDEIIEGLNAQYVKQKKDGEEQ